MRHPDGTAMRQCAGPAWLALGLAGALIAAAAIPANARGARLRERPAATKPEPKIPAGPLLITVTLGSQRVALYADGALVAQSAVSTGVPGHPTPTGIFSVIEKQRWHQSNIYSGAPMPFMQRITWSGIALHAGVLPGYPASHGCIRLHSDFAQFLWAVTKKGARVIVSRESVAPAEFTHPRLFVPKAQPAEPDKQEPRVTANVGTGPDQSANTPEAMIAAAAASLRAAAMQANEEMLLEIAAAKVQAARRKGPISIFISRKDKKLYARQAFEPLFEMPVTIADLDQPIGTHLFTAMAVTDDGAAMRWTVVSMPPERPKPAHNRRDADFSTRGKKSDAPAIAAEQLPAPTAASALDRIEIPREALDRISDLLMPGTSLIVSDHGPGDETGEGTDFIILTRS
jgi:hypothetical protein